TSSSFISGKSVVILRAKRISAFSDSGNGEDSRSLRTLRTNSSLPSISAATAACDRQQNWQSLVHEVYAAISSRKPPLIGAGLRITPSVKLARCDVTSGRNAKRFQICQYSRPAAFVTLIRSAYGLGCGLASTSGRYVGVCSIAFKGLLLCLQ